MSKTERSNHDLVAAQSAKEVTQTCHWVHNNDMLRPASSSPCLLPLLYRRVTSVPQNSDSGRTFTIRTLGADDLVPRSWLH